MKYPLVIPTNGEKVYVQFLTIVNFLVTEADKEGVHSSNPLTQKELQVLAALLKYNAKYRNLPNKERFEYIMSTDVRRKIRTELDIKANHLNNVIARLKTKYYAGSPILLEGEISSYLTLYIDTNLTIEFNLEHESPKQKTSRVDQTTGTEVQSEVRQSEELTLISREVHGNENLGHQKS